MKRLLISLLGLVPFFPGLAQISPEPRFDERIELVTVVNRLVPAYEFSNQGSAYAAVVDTFFSPFSGHPAVILARELRNENSISFDAVISLGLCLELGQDITLNETLAAANLDSRWSMENARRMTRALNQFYHDTSFQAFFQCNEDYFEAATASFREVIEDVDFEWFAKFYGSQAEGRFQVILSLLNRGSYGPSLVYPDGHHDLYAIMGASGFNPDGAPRYGEGDRKTIIHEFNHPFCNPLMDGIFPAIAASVTPAYDLVHEFMERQAYGQPEIMMREILVRTAELRYAKAHGADTASLRQTLEAEKTRGFFWIEDLYHLLSDYEAMRSDYPTLATFMPELGRYHQGEAFLLAKQTLEDELDTWPRIVQTSIANGSHDLAPGPVALVIRFDQPMDTRYNGLGQGKLGREGIPAITGAQWNAEDPSEWIIQLDLAPAKNYSLRFNSQHFRSATRQKPLRESLLLEFSTGD